MSYEKIQIDRKSFDTIINELNVIKLSTSDSNSRIIAEKIIDIMKCCEEEDVLTSLKEKIQEKMSEYKYKNPQLSTALYILLRKLKDAKISKEECIDTFEKLVIGEVFERKIY